MKCTNDIKECQAKIDLLDNKLLAGIIDDTRYVKLVAKYEKESTRLEALIGSSAKDADLWLELAREVFSSSINLSEVFLSADLSEKRRLMTTLGSNWYLGNKKVIFTSRKPYDLLVKCDNNTSWRIFMTKLEPTFSGMFEPRRLASASTRFAPPEKPFALFLQFPPPRFLRS